MYKRQVLYFASYIVLDPGQTGLQMKQVLSEKEYRDEIEKYGYGSFRVGMGAEAIQELLKAIDLEKDSEDLRSQLQDATGQKRARIIKRLEDVYKRQVQNRGKSRASGRCDRACASGGETYFQGGRWLWSVACRFLCDEGRRGYLQ